MSTARCRIIAIAPSATLELVVPVGTQAGEECNFVVPDGCQFSVTVPNGSSAGESMTVEVPSAAEPEQA
eukprot:4041928-Prymnesium_polylepis.1